MFTIFPLMIVGLHHLSFLLQTKVQTKIDKFVYSLCKKNLSCYQTGDSPVTQGQQTRCVSLMSILELNLHVS